MTHYDKKWPTIGPKCKNNSPVKSLSKARTFNHLGIHFYHFNLENKALHINKKNIKILIMKTRFTQIFVTLFVTVNTLAFVPKENIMQGKRILIFSPVFLNEDAYSIEFGFLGKKKLSTYNYNVFGRAFIAGETKFNTDKNRAAALGAKLGVFLPTQKWWPIFLELNFGFAKTSYQKRPWFGKKENNVFDKDMMLAEAGFIYQHKKKLIYRVAYQVSNLDYFEHEIFLSVGGSY
jgi:hypothetical protein